MNNADTRQNMAAQRARAERTQPGLSLIALASCLLLLLAFPVYAQKTSGQITGEVVDQSGAALPDTKITATQVGTNLTREVMTNQDGIYSMPDLPVGIYRISATHTGFKESVVENVTVNVSTTTRQNLSMQVGEVGERVDILADAVQIQQDTGTVG